MSNVEEIWPGDLKVVYATCYDKEDNTTCDHFPFCTHVTYEASCPICEQPVLSVSKYGPYSCEACGFNFFVAVNCVRDFVTKREPDEE